MRLTLDFETASACDLKSAGAWRYAEDPTTEVLCAAWIVEGTAYKWIPAVFNPQEEEAFYILGTFAGDRTVIFEAHNAGFEQAIWHYIMVPRYGMPPIPIERWDCTMARCLYNGLPAKLETAAQVLGLTEQKDMEGSALTISLSKPMTIKTWMERLINGLP